MYGERLLLLGGELVWVCSGGKDVKANEAEPPRPLRLWRRRDGIPLYLEPHGGAEVVEAGGEAQDLGHDVADLGVTLSCSSVWASKPVWFRGCLFGL